MVECNYVREVLYANIEKGVIPRSMAVRLEQSHFGLHNVVEFLKSNDLGSVKEIHLMHLSSANSDAELIKETIQKLTGKIVKVC